MSVKCAFEGMQDGGSHYRRLFHSPGQHLRPNIMSDHLIFASFGLLRKFSNILVGEVYRRGGAGGGVSQGER